MDNKNSQKETINTVLERAKAEWEAAFDAITDGIAVVDLDGTVRRANRALAILLGRDVRNINGTPCCKLFTHHGLDQENCPVLQFPEGKKGHFEVFLPDYRHYAETLLPIVRKGKRLGFVLVVKEVTGEQVASQEKRRLRLKVEEALKRHLQADEAIQGLRRNLLAAEMTGAMATLFLVSQTELKRSFRTIIEGLDLLASSEAPEALRKDVLEAAVRGSRILSKLEELKLEHIERAEDVDMAGLLGELAAERSMPVDSTSIDLSIDAEGLPLVRGNRSQLKAAFSSVLDNAIEAVRGTRSNVSVRARQDKDRIMVEITDQGLGIEAVHLPQVFDPYFSTSDDGRRIGLGLPICLAIVQGHGGSVEVGSEPGEGATVRILLPAAE